MRYGNSPINFNQLDAIDSWFDNHITNFYLTLQRVFLVTDVGGRGKFPEQATYAAQFATPLFHAWVVSLTWQRKTYSNRPMVEALIDAIEDTLSWVSNQVAIEKSARLSLLTLERDSKWIGSGSTSVDYYSSEDDVKRYSYEWIIEDSGVDRDTGRTGWPRVQVCMKKLGLRRRPRQHSLGRRTQMQAKRTWGKTA